MHDVGAVGQIIGRYRLVGELGRGGMGVVFEAEHIELGCRVAIKLLDAPDPAHSLRVARFLREARAAAQTRHLHAVTVIDIGVHEQQWFIVMELLKGETLAALIAREGALAANRVAELLIPVIAAVTAAHEAGVVHRDLKPANIVLAHRGGHIVHPVVTDFGVSKISTPIGPEEITDSHALLGTLHYMAPELTRAADQATPLSDQYSLGVILYECVTGRRPFQGASPYELMHAIVSGKFARPRAGNERVDARLEEIILRAMAADPKQRYPSVRALGAATLAVASAKTWAIWGSELAMDSAPLPTTLSDSRGHQDITPAGIEARTSIWQAQRGRSVLIAAVVAGATVISLRWVAQLRIARPHARAPSAVAAPLPSPSRVYHAAKSEVTQSPSENQHHRLAAANDLSPSGASEGSIKSHQPTPPISALAPRRANARKATASNPAARIDSDPSTAIQPHRLESFEGARERPLEYGSNDAPILE